MASSSFFTREISNDLPADADRSVLSLQEEGDLIKEFTQLTHENFALGLSTQFMAPGTQATAFEELEFAMTMQDHIQQLQEKCSNLKDQRARLTARANQAEQERAQLTARANRAEQKCAEQSFELAKLREQLERERGLREQPLEARRQPLLEDGEDSIMEDANPPPPYSPL